MEIWLASDTTASHSVAHRNRDKRENVFDGDLISITL
jgi:hypothetical protein